MEAHVRYEIIATIAQGDFATVYRARDKELGREVAIKQIHQQYLADPRKLERYWQEAQLLAKLENPYIMTIYDIVRERGWLILELMQGSLQQQLAGNPIDLEDLRLTMIYMLHALHFLQQNGIVHGDVKPSNLLLDRNHRVKLGDFGIARRLSGDDGSVVKGTTKYMAPEVVSDQFGPVGPHSDLYSLGFSAYELLCGSHFDTLFPGLNMFGRDQQIAWMMWHSALDRRLPEIKRVLEGVPEDLAAVIEKLVEKGPAKRYRSAEQVIRDLRSRTKPDDGAEAAAEMAVAAKAARQTRQRRYLMIAALLVSVGLSAAMLLLPGRSAPPPTPPAAGPVEGVLRHVVLEQNLLVFESDENGKEVGMPFDPKLDRILLNDTKVTPTDLRAGDRVVVKRFKDDQGNEFRIFEATRELAQDVSSEIADIDASARIITLATGGDGGGQLRVYVPSTVKIQWNGATEIGGRPIQPVDLAPGDRVQVAHVSGERLRVAQSFRALRTVTQKGFLVSIDVGKRQVSVRSGSQSSATPKPLDVAPECEFTLNAARILAGGKVVDLADLKAGDRVTIEHDRQATRIDANREFSATGVVKSVNYENRRFVVEIAGEAAPVSFLVDDDCDIELAQSSAPAHFASIRSGDKVTIMHMSADLRNPHARAISVTPAADPRTWAIVIGQQQYDDTRLTKLFYTADDAALMRDALLSGYRVPSNQLLFNLDTARLTLQRDVTQFLKNVTAGSQLIVYYAGHAYVDPGGVTRIATKEFDSQRMDQTGIPLDWLIKQLEQCPAQEKLLLLDASHEGTGADLKAQPSSAEMIDKLRDGPTRPVSSSVIVIASCGAGQRGLKLTTQNHGLFAATATAGLAGEADVNGDYRVDSGELYDYLLAKMSLYAAPDNRRQVPVRFLPDANPPRLTAATQDAVRRLLGYLRVSRLGEEVAIEFDAARQIEPKQPDVSLTYALVLLKHNKTADAQRAFESLMVEHPELLLPYHALAWQNFMQRKYDKGIGELEQLVRHLAIPQNDQQYDPYSAHVLELAGAMREFAYQETDCSQLDRAVLERDPLAKDLYTQGINKVRELLKKLDEKIAATSDASEKDRLVRERKRLTYYVSFDFDAVANHIRAELEK